MSVKLTDRHLSKVAEAVIVSKAEIFARDYLKLPSIDISNSGLKSTDTQYSVNYECLRRWMNQDGNDLEQLQKLLVDAVEERVIIDINVLDVIENNADSSTDAILSKLSHLIKESEMNCFCERLEVSLTEIMNFMARQGGKYEFLYTEALKWLQSWRNRNIRQKLTLVDLNAIVMYAMVDGALDYDNALNAIQEFEQELTSSTRDVVADGYEEMEVVPSSEVVCDSKEFMERAAKLFDVDLDAVRTRLSGDLISAAASACEADSLVFQTEAMTPHVDALNRDYDRMLMVNMQKVRNQMEKLKTKKDIVVAVMDSGIFTAHPDLKDSIVGSKCMILNDKEEQHDLTVDNFGHGTFVAGIIRKLAPFAKIFNIKVIQRNGTCRNDDVVSGLLYAMTAKPKIDIINMSFGAWCASNRYSNMLSTVSNSTILLAAAGNDGRMKENSIMFPAAHGMVTAVGSHGTTGFERALHSAIGPDLDFLCPGQDIVSTSHRGGYREASGTSFATPHAAAVAAMVLKFADARGSDYLRSELTNSAMMRRVLRKLGTKYPSRSNRYGYGHLDVWPFVDTDFEELRKTLEQLVTKGNIS